MLLFIAVRHALLPSMLAQPRRWSLRETLADGARHWRGPDARRPQEVTGRHVRTVYHIASRGLGWGFAIDSRMSQPTMRGLASILPKGGLPWYGLNLLHRVVR